MTRQVTDQLYIDLGYFTPENYFVYQARASLTAASTATVTASVGVIKAGASTQTATASVSCDATRLRTQLADAQLTSTATVSTSAVKTVRASSSQSSAFTQTTTAFRIIEASGAFTGAFTPTLTVDVFKNHTAIIDAIFTVTTVGVANRATSITTSTIAALDAQAAKTVDIQSNQTSTATISAQAVTTKSATSTLTSTATVTCDALNVQFASASMAVGSVLYSRVFKRYDVPWQIELTSGLPSIDTSIKKWGDGSLTSTSGTSYIRYYPSDDWPGDLVLEFWHYRSTSTAGIQINLYRLSDSAIQWNLSTGANRVGINYASGTSPTTTSFNTATNTLSTGWQHIVYVYDATQAESAIFIDGIRRYFRQDPVMAIRSGRKYFEVLIPNNDYKIDELRILKVAPNSVGFDQRSTTCTVPTGPYRNTSTTRFLAHYDTDFAADFTELELGQASLSSTITLSATGQETAAGSATLTSQSTISVIGSLLNVAQASLSSAFTMSVTAGELQEFASAQTASASLTATPVKTARIDSSASSQATVTVTAIRIQSASAQFTGAFTPTLTVDVLRNHTAILDVVATLSAQINGNFTDSAVLTSTVTQTASVGVIKQGNISVASSSTLNAVVAKLPGSGAQLTSTASVSAIVGLRQQANAAVTVTASISTTVTRIQTMASTQISVASLQLTEANVFRNLGDQTLSAQATVSAQAFRIKPFVSAMSAQATVSAEASKTTDSQSSMSVVSTQSTQAVKTTDVQTQFSSIATQLSAAFVNATGTILLESTATVTALIGVIKPFETPNVSGVQMRKPRWVQYTSAITSSLDDHTVIAFWARKIGATSGRFIWNRERSFEIFPGGLPGGNWNYNRYEHTYGFSNRTTFYFSGYNETGPAGNASLYLEFPNTIPDDQNWHHYVVYWQKFQPNSLGNGYIMRLYIDGSQVGIQTSLAPANRRITAGWYDPLDLGYDTQVEMGQLAVWNSASDFIINDFANIDPDLYNNGYVELGSSGTVNGNTPYIYDRLDNPFSANVRGVLNNTLSDPRNETYFTLTEANQAEDRLYGNQAFFNLSASFLGVFLFASDLTATTSMTCSAVKTARAQSTQSAQAEITATANTQTGIVAVLSAQFSIDAQGNLAPAGGAALADHSATLECVIGYLRSQSSTQTTQATMTTTAMVIPPVSGDAVLTVFANQTTIAGYLIRQSSTQSAQFTQVTEATEIVPIQGSAQLTAQAQLTCVMTRVRPGISLEMSAGTLTCAATVIPPIRTEATLASAFTLTVNINASFNTITLTASSGTLSCAAVKTARIAGQIQSTATVIPNATKRTGIVAFLTAQNFVLTAGDIINIDPYLTLRIRPESRTLIIDQETRTIRILPESRTLTIEGYSQ